MKFLLKKIKSKIVLMICFGFLILLPIKEGFSQSSDDVYIGTQEFEKLKSLVGYWVGEQHKGDTMAIVRVEYMATSNGSVVIETLFKDTAQEMVSVYHDVGDKISVTRYCYRGNHPKMDYIKTEETSMKFKISDSNHPSMIKNCNMKDFSIDIKNENHVEQLWTMKKGIKDSESIKLVLRKLR